MASFTDNPNILGSFNPYISQIPVQDYRAAEMYKQGKYDQGVQAVQSYIDTTTGLDVDPKYKGYLQNSVNSLTDEVKKIAGSDFSNMQLVSQVGGAASKIIGDKIIQTGIQSSANNRSNQQRIAKDKEDGKLTPDNEAYYYNQYEQWRQNPDLSQGFKGSYVQHVDVDEKVQKAITAAHADSDESLQEVRDSNGKIMPDVLYKKLKEGLLSGKVANIVNTVFSDPQISQQLGITGWYTYRGYTPEMLKETQDRTIGYYRDETNKRILAMGIKSNLSSEEASKADVESQALRQQLQDKEAEYSRSVEKIYSNPEAFKVDLYTQNMRDRYVSNGSWSKTSTILEKNPAAEMQLQRATYDLNVQKEQWDENYQSAELTLKQNEDRRQEEELKLKKEGKIDKDGNVITPAVQFSYGKVDDTEFNSSTGIALKEKAKYDKDQAFAEIVSKAVQGEVEVNGKTWNLSDLYVQDREGKWVQNKEKFKGMDYSTGIKPVLEAAIKEVNNQYVNGKMNGYYSDLAKKYYDGVSYLTTLHKEEAKIDEKYAPALNKIKAEYGSPVNPSMLDYYLVDKKAPGWEAAQERLSAMPNYLEFERTITGDPTYLPEGGTSWSVGSNTHEYNKLKDYLGKNKDLSVILQSREKDYKNLQSGELRPSGTFLPKDASQLTVLNTRVSDIVAKLAGEKKATITGGYNLAEWLDPTKQGTATNTYQVSNKNGQFFLQIRRNEDGKFKDSGMIPVNENTLQQFGVDTKEPAFRQEFGRFLNIFNQRKTTDNFNSPDAESKALLRRNIGEYSVAFHLESQSGGYIPHIYIRNRKTGEVLRNGTVLDIAELAKNDPRLSEEDKKNPLLKTSVMSEEKVMKTLGEDLNENQIKAILAK